jgi:hypothetical protein
VTIRIELAAPGDDGALRRLLRESPLPGRIALSYEREPCYFGAAVIEGSFHQVLVARDGQTGEVVGCANRSVRELFVNGEAQPVGYLSHLRLRPRMRRGIHLARCMVRAFELCRALHRDGRAAFYLLSIVADNHSATRLLTSGLPGYPRLRASARLVSCAIPVGRPRRPLAPGGGLRLARGSERLLPGIVECLECYGRRRQFAPHWTLATLCRPQHTPGLAAEDFFVAMDGERVVGCLALWDQRAVKQTVVRGYHRHLERWRKPLNRFAALAGRPQLPDPGTELRCCFASHRAVDGDSARVFAALLRALYNHAAGERRCRYLMIGFGEADPWRAVLRGYRALPYRSDLYLAGWEDGEAAISQVDGRLPAPEVAVL